MPLDEGKEEIIFPGECAFRAQVGRGAKNIRPEKTASGHLAIPRSEFAGVPDGNAEATKISFTITSAGTMKDTDDDVGVCSQATGPDAMPWRFAGYNAGPPARRAGSASSAGPPADGDWMVLMASTTEEADKLADDLPTGRSLEDHVSSILGQVMTKWYSQGNRAPDCQATREPGAQAPKDAIKKQLLAKIHVAADRACTLWLLTALPAGPPAAPPEPAPAMPNDFATRYFDISQGDAPPSVSTSSAPNTWSIAVPETPGLSRESPDTNASQAAS